MREGVFIAIAILVFSGCSTSGSTQTHTAEGLPQSVAANDGVINYLNTTEWIKSDDGVLSLRFSSDKTEYVSGETIEVKIELRNDSDSKVEVEAVTYALGSYGNALSVEGPAKLRYIGPWKEYYVPPSEILPGEVISDTTTLSVVHWQNLDMAGEYKVICTYQSGSITQDKGLWNGSIRPAILEYKVKDKRIDAGRAKKIALNHVRSGPHLENIDTTRISITFRDDVQTYVVDLAWKDAGQIQPGFWDTGYYVVVDARSGDVREAYPYER